jgi:transcriptional regulator with XRE-family HTH domain
MSAQKPGSKAERARQLRDVRHRLQWTQQQMAEALGLDASYLSQLENGRRKVGDWYLKKAGEFERTKTPNILANVTADSYSMQTSAEACIAYFTRFLATCTDPAKIVWAYVELQQRFPLDKWTTEAEVDSKEAGTREASSKQLSSAAETVPKPAVPSDRVRQKS